LTILLNPSAAAVTNVLSAPRSKSTFHVPTASADDSQRVYRSSSSRLDITYGDVSIRPGALPPVPFLRMSPGLSPGLSRFVSSSLVFGISTPTRAL
jgi:hypothetical protein